MIRPRPRLRLLALLLVLWGCADRDSAASDAPVSLQVEFHALWWSEAQMESLDPDAPPPMETEVLLERWEYTDPIGTPHPDVFSVRAELVNRTDQPQADIVVRTETRWSVGPLTPDPTLTPRPGPTLAPISAQTLPPGGRVRVELGSIDLKRLQDELIATTQWPFGFEIRVVAARSGASAPLAEVTARLPILPGD